MGLFGPKRHTKSIGQQTEAAIITKLLEVGYNVLIPYLGENLRYDLVIEDADRKFWRIQCKTGKLHNSEKFIDFNAASSYYHHRKEGTIWGRKAYHGQIDYFAVYCSETRSVYLVPVDHVPRVLRDGCVCFLPETSKRRTSAGPKIMNYKRLRGRLKYGAGDRI